VVVETGAFFYLCLATLLVAPMPMLIGASIPSARRRGPFERVMLVGGGLCYLSLLVIVVFIAAREEADGYTGFGQWAVENKGLVHFILGRCCLGFSAGLFVFGIGLFLIRFRAWRVKLPEEFDLSHLTAKDRPEEPSADWS